MSYYGRLSDSTNTCTGGFGPCVSQQKCYDSDNPESITSSCWIMTFCFVIVGCILIIISEFGRELNDAFFHLFKILCRCCFQKNVERRISKVELEEISESLSSPFIKTVRMETNFLRNHDDSKLQIPTEYSPEYVPIDIQNGIKPIRGFLPTSNNKLLQSPSLYILILGSLGIALIVSAGSTVFWLLIDYESTCHNDTSNLYSAHAQAVSDALDALLTVYAFYPIFLLVGYIGYLAMRWREWMANCHSLQGCMRDIGVACGGSFTEPPTLEQRKLLFKIYRHLNAVHAVTYRSISPSLCNFTLDDFCDRLGLLTEDEIEQLRPCKLKVREAVITKVTSDIALLCKADNVAITHSKMMDIIRALGSKTATHGDFFVKDNPNLYLNVMFLVVNILIIFSLASYPFTLMISGFPKFPCFQPAALMGSFLILFAYRSAFCLMSRIRNPFSWTKDRIKVDMLLASTDMCLFTVLRSAFETAIDDDDDEVPLKQQSMTT